MLVIGSRDNNKKSRLELISLRERDLSIDSTTKKYTNNKEENESK